jgi:2-C-methyl-D-erythritol 2,4-cyclodiphosphate synthase
MSQSFKIGQGFDVHAFGEVGEGDHLVVGGVRIAHSAGLIAHSDGDVLLHAVCDALLGALALGDIGHHFPDTDPNWKNANSRDLLKAVMQLISARGYKLGNLDSTLIAQAPRFAMHIDQMRANIAEDMDASVDQVSVKATTTEKLGFTGRGEGIAAQATLLLQPLTP